MTKTPVGKVPCGACKQCCRGEAIVLHPEDGDDLTKYLWQWVNLPKFGLKRVLKRQENGDCIYLTEAGCSIHDDAPALCRAFDCRAWYASMTRPQRRALANRNSHIKTVLRAGRDRVMTLDMTGMADELAVALAENYVTTRRRDPEKPK